MDAHGRFRKSAGIVALCAMLLPAACAQSVHQTERLAKSDFMVDPGYAGAQSYSYWPGPGYAPGYGIGYGAGYWGNPFGCYGRHRFRPGHRPPLPPHAPPQFKKKL
jgi:hypothetical protein